MKKTYFISILASFILISFNAQAYNPPEAVVCNGCTSLEKRKSAVLHFRKTNTQKVTVIDFNSLEKITYAGHLTPNRDPNLPDEYRLTYDEPSANLKHDADEAFAIMSSSSYTPRLGLEDSPYDSAYDFARAARSNPQAAHDWMLNESPIAARFQMTLSLLGGYLGNIPILSAFENHQTTIYDVDGAFVVVEMPSPGDVPMVIKVIAVYDSDGNLLPLTRSELMGPYGFTIEVNFDNFVGILRGLGVAFGGSWQGPECSTCRVTISCDTSSGDEYCDAEDSRD